MFVTLRSSDAVKSTKYWLSTERKSRLHRSGMWRTCIMHCTDNEIAICWYSEIYTNIKIGGSPIWPGEGSSLCKGGCAQDSPQAFIILLPTKLLVHIMRARSIFTHLGLQREELIEWSGFAETVVITNAEYKAACVCMQLWIIWKLIVDSMCTRMFNLKI